MIHTISLSDRQFLNLVRSSLWQQAAEESLFLDSSVDWKKISQLALEQTVGVLAFEGALSLPNNIRPPKEWIQKALSFIECNRRTNLLLDGCVAESVSRLRDEGITAVLLKGQAYARAYPKSEMRQCGDIDLYVGEKCYLPAYEAINRFGWESEERFLPDAKHYGCTLRGIHIELHRIAGILPSRSADLKFQLWSQSELKGSQEFLMIGGEKVRVPTPLFDIIFVFMHLYLHFLNGGIGLRHICDWTMLMHSHAKEINNVELEQRLKEFHLLKAWKKFTPIAVEHLGLPSEECPFYSSKYRGDADRILSFILTEGNFGRAKQPDSIRPDGYLAGKLYSFKRHSKRMYSKLRIDPHTISRTYCSYVIKGITRVMKDIMKRE